MITLAQIKSMFAAGQTWRGTRTTETPSTTHETVRVVEKVRTRDIVFTIDGKRYYTPLPKARDVLEADLEQGVVAYRVNATVTVRLHRVATQGDNHA
jgi:hypothetical protein